MEENKKVLTDDEMQQIENNPLVLVYLSQYDSYSEALESNASTIKRARGLKRSLEYTNEKHDNADAINSVIGIIEELLVYKQKLKKILSTIKTLVKIHTETDFDTVYALYKKAK